jgi:hypothetical protein
MVKVGSNRFTATIWDKLPSKVANAMQADKKTKE